MSKEFWTEIHDTKSSNVKTRPVSRMTLCDECKAWCGHEITCSQVTVETIAKLLIQSRENEQRARDRAAKWLDQCNRLSGRVSILRHENNKLRAANERLKKQINAG